MRKTRIDFDIPLVFMKEGKAFVAFSPALDLYEHGDSYKDVLDAFRRKLTIFLSELVKMGTLEKVLFDCGWTKIKNRLIPPQIIDRKIESVHLAV
ncbi:MAG: hypothetical protein HYT89_02520 [Candidatus Omnitrophica bacterium]|nr:hypothetical protein [Candidatus Omnitrophota bacterium]